MRTGYLRKNNGFTLLEVLITAAISSVMVLALISGATGYFSRDSQEQQRVFAQQRLRLVTSVIAADIREAGYIYQDVDLNTIVDLVNRGPSNAKLNGTTPKLAVLVPCKVISSEPDCVAGKFRLVIYAISPVPDVTPFNLISSIKDRGNVIYRWYSQPGDFDPSTQKQEISGHLPSALDGNFITYGGTNTDTLPPVLIVGVADNGLSAISTGGQFGPANSDIGKTITVQTCLTVEACQNPAAASQDPATAKDVPQLNARVQSRNLGLPPTPMPNL